jgi:hypothetical protein
MKDPLYLLFAIAIGAASAIAVVMALVLLSSCSADWNAPHPIIPEQGNPCGLDWHSCGLDWHSCGNGRCCYDTDDCRPSGGCAFGGIQGPTWGARAPDAGPVPAEYPQQTPSEIYRRRRY